MHSAAATYTYHWEGSQDGRGFEIQGRGTRVLRLADGQLRGQEFARAVEAVSRDDDDRATWHVYHLVGDVLRSGDAAGHNDLAFVERLQLRLKSEDVVVQSADAIKSIASDAMNTRNSGQFDTQADSANASRFR